MSIRRRRRHHRAAPAHGRGPATPDKMAEFEYRFDRADTDAIGPVDRRRWQSALDRQGQRQQHRHGGSPEGALPASSGCRRSYPLQSYAIPTHTERQGPFSSTANKGYNIEHFRDFNNAGPTVAFGIESPGHFAQGGANGGSGSYTPNAVGGGTYGMSGIYTAKVGGSVGRPAWRRPQLLHVCQLRLAQPRRGRRARLLHDGRFHSRRVHQAVCSERGTASRRSTSSTACVRATRTRSTRT